MSLNEPYFLIVRVAEMLGLFRLLENLISLGAHAISWLAITGIVRRMEGEGKQLIMRLLEYLLEVYSSSRSFT